MVAQPEKGKWYIWHGMATIVTDADRGFCPVWDNNGLVAQPACTVRIMLDEDNEKTQSVPLEELCEILR